MAQADGLDALQGLHQDLLAFCDNRLHDIDRLVGELKSRIDEFRALLDHKQRNDQSRKQLIQGIAQITPIGARETNTSYRDSGS